MQHRVDLNADLGESFGAWRMGDDPAMLDLVTTANVACGFHGGDPRTMRETCAAAAARGVAIGAHPSYRDLVGFGRRFMDVAPADLEADVLYQLGALDAACRAAGARLGHVKPHGALYSAVVGHREQARAVVAAIATFDSSLAVLGLPGSALLDEADAAGLRTVGEAFADRAYTPEGTLVPRNQPGAVLHDPEVVARRVARLATDSLLEAIDGTDITMRAVSVCIHGDTPGSVELAQAVRRAVTDAGVELAPFVPARPGGGA